MVLNRLKPIILLLVAGLLITLIYAYYQLQASEPILQGEVQVRGLLAEAKVARDAQGIPTIRAHSRADSAFALGYLHGQERFFQMDLLRKNSAGELSELFGELALAFDKKMRRHQFRKRATLAVDNLPKDHRDILNAYTMGVNQGLSQLGSAPFEYHILRTEPQPWQGSDSALVLLSMFIDLQPEWSQSERSLAVMNDLLPKDWFEFLTSQGGQWDAPIHGQALSPNRTVPQKPLSQFKLANEKENLAQVSDYQFVDQIHYGSNNWSVSGALTRHGSAMVADDMHLKLRVPNIWYRASIYLQDGRRLTGASLPGTPAIVVGSNEHIAWGFTNSQGDYHDVIVLKTNADNSQYLTAQGWQDFKVETEVVQVKGQEAQSVSVKLTQWGPVIGENQKGQLLAMRWVTHDVNGVNFHLLDLENANNVEQALLVAAKAGVPGQNLNVVDKDGNQAWTIMGRLPKRFGFKTGLGERNKDGYSGSQYPQDWSRGDKGWDGYLSAQEYPKVVNPKDGRLWTANARIVSDELLQKVGTHNYALGARQQQIRDDMYALQTFSEQDFLDIQLDDRAVFLQRWHGLISELIAEQDQYQALQDLLQNWQGRASADSGGYLFVKRFRERVVDQTAGEIYRFVKNNSNEFWPGSIDNFVEYPVWQLITEQPNHQLPHGFDSWHGFLLAMVDDTIDTLTKDGESLSDIQWGQANTLAIRHPLSKAVPMLGWLLDMDAQPMHGDTYMPRVQKPNSGASQRMAVAPGHEDEGYFHMATGQSGHPLSPYFDKGHDDWVEGRLSSFLPGESQWQLQLKPQQ